MLLKQMKEDTDFNMDKEYETMIGIMLKNYLPIEWMRYTMFHISDVYSRIPMLVFRLKEKDEKFDTLLKCIENFKGNANWEIFRTPYTRKENYFLTVSEVKQMYQGEKEKLMPQKDYFGDEYIKICDKAVSDIPELASHIERWFKEDTP